MTPTPEQLQITLSPYIAKLDSIQNSDLKPYPKGEARMKALIEAMVAMAAAFHFPARVQYMSTGELTFCGDLGKPPQSGCEPYGEALAAWLNTIPTRTGMVAHTGFVMACNGWCYINHFDAERLLRSMVQPSTVSA